MATHLIRLEGGEWEYDDAERLGKPGGFGEVFRGQGSVGPVAIKRLKINATQAAHRELEIGKALTNQALQNIVPILDLGQDSNTDQYFLVMPVCDFSLQDKMDQANGVIDVKTAISAIKDIIAGLKEVENITHRDLKPANVLFYEGQWKIAD